MDADVDSSPVGDVAGPTDDGSGPDDTSQRKTVPTLAGLRERAANVLSEDGFEVISLGDPSLPVQTRCRVMLAAMAYLNPRVICPSADIAHEASPPGSGGEEVCNINIMAYDQTFFHAAVSKDRVESDPRTINGAEVRRMCRIIGMPWTPREALSMATRGASVSASETTGRADSAPSPDEGVTGGAQASAEVETRTEARSKRKRDCGGGGEEDAQGQRGRGATEHGSVVEACDPRECGSDSPAEGEKRVVRAPGGKPSDRRHRRRGAGAGTGRRKGRSATGKGEDYLVGASRRGVWGVEGVECLCSFAFS